MVHLITNEYVSYGGDFYKQLNLVTTQVNFRLELTDDWNSVQLHLTSTDDKYKQWLLKYHRVLTSLGEAEWFTPVYYREYISILDKLDKLFALIQ